MLGNHMIANKLIDYDLYKFDDDKLYLKLKYWVEDDAGEYEIIFPKVRLPIEKLLSIDNSSEPIKDFDGMIKSCNTSHIKYEDDNILEALPGYTIDAGDKACRYTVKKIKDKVQRITLDDIEKKFGCKVEIVKER